MTSRDFQHAARQRHTTAEFLCANTYNLDAMYLAGYTIECSLKALIPHLTPAPDRVDMLSEIGKGAAMHRPEILNGKLKDLGRPLPSNLVKKIRRAGWTTDLRYESGRADTGETRGLLRTAKEVYDWVEGQL